MPRKTNSVSRKKHTCEEITVTENKEPSETKDHDLEKKCQPKERQLERHLRDPCWYRHTTQGTSHLTTSKLNSPLRNKETNPVQPLYPTSESSKHIHRAPMIEKYIATAELCTMVFNRLPNDTTWFITLLPLVRDRTHFNRCPQLCFLRARRSFLKLTWCVDRQPVPCHGRSRHVGRPVDCHAISQRTEGHGILWPGSQSVHLAAP